MRVEPFDWNVVVVGYWNPAILTPSGIAKRLFGLPEGTPVIVEVPMDGLASPRVRHEGIIVTAEMGRLSLTNETPTLTDLERTRRIASKAINALPETPLTAAGFNIGFKLDDPPEQLLRDTSAGIDSRLSDAEFEIKTRIVRRTLAYGKGELNLEVQQTDAETQIKLNFHRRSSQPTELREWLEVPAAEIREVLTRILDRVTGIPFQEDWQ